MELMVVSVDTQRSRSCVCASLSFDSRPQMHMEEPCFDFLRTKETLGSVSLLFTPHKSSGGAASVLTDLHRLIPSRYQVYPTCRNTSGVLGFSVTVETQATKFR